MMQQTKNTQDEVTVHEFLSQVKEILLFLKRLCTLYFRELGKRKAIHVFLLLCAIAGALSFIFHPIKKYEATASYKYDSPAGKLYGEMLDKVNGLIQTHSYTQLHQYIHLPLQQLESIQKIEAKNIYGSPLSDDMTNSKDKIFYISVTSSNATVFDSLGTVLENYLNNNISVRETLQRETEEFTQGILYRKKALTMLDSATSAYIKSMNRNTSPSSLLPANASQFNISQIFDEGKNITQEIVDMQSFLNDRRIVKLQEPFMASANPVQSSKLKIILLAVACFVAASLIIIFISVFFIKKKYASQ
ncbi:hypothetical protein A9P82_03440 [Arachidicoccus ginsenosidimutans]|uniref:hypothetical protein n=1 Tax=Arachidicoccus sp. BS20 TaxID=1850526 RepID=UPI0007F0A210|nr:hypothetical protein [Arachidicoccus sp. BS20]ANI88438.1 hypothetical protein A9P82_03440 [Arachidicoccus sp. BS20]